MMLTQILPVEVREVTPAGAERRRWTFTGATERGVETPWGREHLRMSGARLNRYATNPVVLDAHNRTSALGVVGRADVRREGRTLAFDVEFASTRRARAIEQLVADGFVRACSIGFMPDPQHTRTIATHETDGEGDDCVKGPATVIHEWELLELSILPVGADQDALRRGFYEEARAMVDKASPAAAAEQRPAMETTSASASASTPVTAPATRAEIEAICPRGLEAIGERCLIEGKTLVETRAALLAEHARLHPPVGTPEPPASGYRAPGGTAASAAPAQALTVADLRQALVSL